MHIYIKIFMNKFETEFFKIGDSYQDVTSKGLCMYTYLY